MNAYDWIGDVLADLEDFCRRNNLHGTKLGVVNAKSAFQDEIESIRSVGRITHPQPPQDNGSGH